MADKRDKVFLNCSAKARQTPFGEVITLGIKRETLIAFANENANANGYVNLNIKPRREVGQYGDTHSVQLDTWEPKARRESAGRTVPARSDDFDPPF